MTVSTDAVDCVFCRIVAGIAPAVVLRRYSNSIVIVPIDPVTVGHVLVVPRTPTGRAAVAWWCSPGW